MRVNYEAVLPSALIGLGVDLFAGPFYALLAGISSYFILDDNHMPSNRALVEKAAKHYGV